MRFIGMTGTSIRMRRLLANEIVKQMAEKYELTWNLVSIDDIVMEKILNVLDSSVDKQQIVVWNPHMILSFRSSFYWVGDDFWLATTIKEVEKMYQKGKENFIILDMCTRGEHEAVSENLYGATIMVHSPEPNSHCMYRPATLDFDYVVTIEDIEEIESHASEICEHYVSNFKTIEENENEKQDSAKKEISTLASMLESVGCDSCSDDEPSTHPEDVDIVPKDPMFG